MAARKDLPMLTVRGTIAFSLATFPVFPVATIAMGMLRVDGPVEHPAVAGWILLGALVSCACGLLLIPKLGYPRQGWSNRRALIGLVAVIVGAFGLSGRTAEALVSGDWTVVASFFGLMLAVFTIPMAVTLLTYGRTQGRPVATTEEG